MPRCQRTFQRLPAAVTDPATGAARWVCPHCAEAEVYETVRDPDLAHYAQIAYSACAADFGNPPDAQRPTLLLWGLRPECVLEPIDRRYDLYLQRASDPYQARLQIGHEVFHRVASGGGLVCHWTHEMLACVVSVRLLRRHGGAEYADLMEREYLAQSEFLSLPEMIRASPWTDAVYPPGFYGRAYATGLALTQAVGWSHLRRLARCCLAASRTPDVAAWIARLPDAALQQAARAVLTPSADAQG